MKLFLIVIFWLISLQSSAQSNIDGKYLWTDGAGSSAQMLQFKGNDVVYTSFEGDSAVLKGTYSIKNKVIKLSFDKPKIFSTFLIKEDTLDKNINSRSIKLKIFDGKNNNIPFKNAVITIKTCENSKIFLFSDDTGSINFISEDKNLKSFDIVTLGYDIITVPINRNYGTIEVKCVLKFNRYDSFGHIPKLMNILNKNEIIDVEHGLVYRK